MSSSLQYQPTTVEDIENAAHLINTVDPRYHRSDPTAPAYISYCRACQGMTGCCADELHRRADVAAFVAACIRAGDYIQRADSAAVWVATWCTCINDNGQPLLFTAERLVTTKETTTL